MALQGHVFTSTAKECRNIYAKQRYGKRKRRANLLVLVTLKNRRSYLAHSTIKSPIAQFDLMFKHLFAEEWLNKFPF
jgi:hypothetical protein